MVARGHECLFLRCPRRDSGIALGLAEDAGVNAPLGYGG